jgi:acyl-CoA synthetase (AMP-forming)/AMP-acid ligase II
VQTIPNSADDEVLVLFTGYYWKQEAGAPFDGQYAHAAATICLSWDLTPAVNCNLMPLFHVGGIVRQVFSPLMSGGCVICCPSFDPSIFWALLRRRLFRGTAAPTMHQLTKPQVDDSSSQTLEEQIRPNLRMIANAAGTLTTPPRLQILSMPMFCHRTE